MAPDEKSEESAPEVGNKRPRLFGPSTQGHDDGDCAKKVDSAASSSEATATAATTKSICSTSTLQRLLGRRRLLALRLLLPPRSHHPSADDDDDKDMTIFDPALLGTTCSTHKHDKLLALRSLLERHGLRTSVVASPRRGLSVYKDSFAQAPAGDNAPAPDNVALDDNAGREFLAAMFGLHSLQNEIEEIYSSSVKNLYCLMLFCQRIRSICAIAVETNMNTNIVLARLLQETEDWCCDQWDQTDFLLYEPSPTADIVGTQQQQPEHPEHPSSASADRRVTQIQQLADTAAHPSWRASQWEHEYRRIRLQNTTLANAYLSLLTNSHGFLFQEIYFKPSSPQQPQFERITVYLDNPTLDDPTPPQPSSLSPPQSTFVWMPRLSLMLQSPCLERVAHVMVQQFWHELRRRGYRATVDLQAAMGPALQTYLQSGIGPRYPSSLSFLL